MSIKTYLTEEEMPRHWYNLAADLPNPVLPALGPDGKPVPPEAWLGIFPRNIVDQEYSTERWISIPEEILDIYYRWRPTPLRRAVYLEKLLGTPAKIFYKDESVSPAGSHKPNTAVPQAWYNQKAGTKVLTTETGAGQWGSALAFACKLVGLECRVFMVKISFEQKPFRKMLMETWGASCVSSPSTLTNAGRRFLEKDPDTPGSLGMAISEAVEAAASDRTGNTKYSLGSVLNHVMLHQTIIGLEAKKQLQKLGIGNPDVVIGCVGGGSNFAGLAFPFVREKIHGADIEIIPVEPTSCPTLTRGIYTYDFGDSAGTTPLIAMHTLGHNFVPDPIHAGGLRYHGISPLVSQAVVEGLLRPRAIAQNECFAAGITWARSEGFIIAPETSHAVAATIQEALKAKEEGKEKIILMNLSGHGLLDLVGYNRYLEGKLADHELPQEQIDRAESELNFLPKAVARKSGQW
jgi:tryptophan synthase beta chain